MDALQLDIGMPFCILVDELRMYNHYNFVLYYSMYFLCDSEIKKKVAVKIENLNVKQK